MPPRPPSQSEGETPIEPASGPGPDPDPRPLLEVLGDVDWLTPSDADARIGTVDYLHPLQARGLAVAGDAAAHWLRQTSAAVRARTFAALRVRGLVTVLEAAGAHGAVDRVAVETAGLSLATTHWQAHDAVYALRRALAESRAPRMMVHGVLLEVFGLGILLTGRPGVGKSELALELLGRGHRLVADDAVELRRMPGELIEGSGPALLRNFLEVRGLGILDACSMFGPGSVRARVRVDLALDLQHAPAAGPEAYLQRLQGRRGGIRWLDVELPRIILPVAIGHNLATLVEAACRDFWLRLYGKHADVELAQRQQAALDRHRS